QAAGLLLQLRQKWHSLFLRRMRAPSRRWSEADERTLRAIVAVLSTEEQSAGLQQPSGIGRRPRPMASEELSLPSTWRSTNSRKSSAETELSDDSSNTERVLMKSTSPVLHHPKKHEEEKILPSKRTSGDKSDQTSVKSTDSSSYPSPCASLSSAISGK
ncbi:putative ATP-dependent RNA helicase YTHDC2, partial [Mesitornis unicolor]